MRRLVLKMLFSNYERGLINCALYNYSVGLNYIKSETALGDSRDSLKLATEFRFKREDKIRPLKSEL